MSIIQGLLASINVPASSGGGSNFTPSDTGLTLGPSWTVEVIAELTPTQFWATMWGNEVWSSQLGHIAYFTSTTNLNVGSPGGTDGYDLTGIDISSRAHWAFTHTDGAGISVYRNAVLLTTNSPGYVQSQQSSNTLLIGARHTNDGTGQTDYCPGTYSYNNITQSALDGTAIQASYDSLKSTYGLP